MEMRKSNYKGFIICMILIVAIASIAMLAQIAFLANKADEVIMPTENTVDATSGTGAYIDLIDMTTPEYQLIMPEKPNKTMAEFLTGVNRETRITIAYLQHRIENIDIYLETTYQIDMVMQKSKLSDENYYFIEIDTGIADGMSPKSIAIQVNETNIDEIWHIIENAINEYNENANRRNAGEIEYDEITWIDIFKMIELRLSENNIPITERINGVFIINP